MAIGDTYELVIKGRYQGQDVVNVYHYLQTANGTAVRPESALNEGFVTLVQPAWEAVVVSDAVMLLITITKMAPLPKGPPYAFNTSWVGINGDNGLPSECAGVVKKLSDFPGKHGRGRNYIAGCPEQAIIQSTGLWAPGFFALLNDLAIAINSPVVTSTGEGFAPCVISRTLLVPHIVNRASVNDAPRAQRRRQPGRGK